MKTKYMLRLATSSDSRGVWVGGCGVGGGVVGVGRGWVGSLRETSHKKQYKKGNGLVASFKVYKNQACCNLSFVDLQELVEEQEASQQT